MHPLTAGATSIDLETLGGKALSLAKMTAAGFPVPPGFTVTTAAYRQFVADNNLQQTIVDLAKPEVAGQRASFDGAAESIQALFARFEPSDEFKAEIATAYAALWAGEPAPGEPVAVRSSANAEDLPDLSFAGQQDTYLNVRGADAVIAAVCNCWASLWTARAIGYRHDNAIAQDAVAMAVVVQTMVPAEVSGILFTVNPVSGDRDEMIVNSSFGLGEAIVGGEITPDTFVIDRETRTVKETSIGAKDHMIVPADGQGTDTRAVAETERKRVSLPEPLLKELAQQAMNIEQLAGGVPQDIEWAVSEARLFLLQSRPITNLPPAPLKEVRWQPPPGAQLIRRKLSELIPGPVSPLFQDLYMEHAMEIGCARRMGWDRGSQNLPFDKRSVRLLAAYSIVNGYVYQLQAAHEVTHLLDLRDAVYPEFKEEISREYDNRLRREVPADWPDFREVALPAYLSVIEEWKKVDPAAARDEQLLWGIGELAIADAGYFFDSALALARVRHTDARLQRFLQDTAPGSGFTSGMLLSGFETSTVMAQKELWAIALRVRADPALNELFVVTPASRLFAVMQDRLASGVLEAVNDYLDMYGHQIHSLDFAEPSLMLDPLPVLVNLKRLVQDLDYDPPTHEVELAKRREAALQEVRDHFRGTPDEEEFEAGYKLAKRVYPDRDDILFYSGAGWPVLQRFTLELGRRLRQAGIFVRDDDVYYLQRRELEEAIRARYENRAVPELSAKVTERRELREARKRLTAPVAIPKEVKLMLRSVPALLSNAEGSNTLEGIPVSPGKVTGEVSVIHSPADFEKMKPGTILVCPMTTPAWTQLFAHTTGLVTDIGSITAHGAIVAREYGIPAVLGLSDITQRLRSGQRITIDGDMGIVTIEESNPQMEDI